MNENSEHELAELIIAGSKLFSCMNETEIAHLADRFETVRHEQGGALFNEGDPGDYMYIVGEGEVGVFKMVGQSEHEMLRLGPGEHVGEMAMISTSRRNATVRAATPLVCVRLDADGFNALLDEEPHFAQRMLKVISERLRDTNDAAMQDLVMAHQALSFSLAKLADSRDPETGGHLYRVREYCVLLAELLRDHPKFCDVIDDSFIENIYLVAPLHDIGKVAIPDGILLKQGKLTDAEFEIMSTHTTLGAHAVDTVLEFCDFDLFHMARRVILCHHERYDGLGYPRGISGEEIPIEARIMTLADIYDALLSERVYKRAFEYHEAKAEIEQNAGSRFDVEMTAVMIDNLDQFEAIHRKFSEGKQDFSATPIE